MRTPNDTWPRNNYTADANFTIRVAVMPADILRQERDDPIDDVATGDGSQTAHLWETSELLRLAIEHSAPDLASNLRRLDSLDRRRRERALSACRRYVNRMSTRATPFGLMAAVARGVVHSDTNLLLNEQTIDRIVVMENAAFFVNDALTHAVPTPRDVLRLNDLAFYARNRLWLHQADFYGKQSRESSSVRATPAVTAIIEAVADSGAPYDNVVKEMLCKYGETYRSRITQLIEQLIRTQHLLLIRDQAATNRHHVGAPALPAVPTRHIRSHPVYLFDSELHASFGRFIKSANELGHEASKERVGNSALHIDSHANFGGDEPTLSFSDVRQIEQLADVLVALTPANGYPRTMARYAAAFESRYGSNALVPVLELLAEDASGLGPPDGYLHPPRAADFEVPPAAVPPQTTSRDKLLYHLLSGRRRKDQCGELQLTATDCQALAGVGTDTLESRPLPASLDIHVSLWRDANGATWVCPTDTAFAYGYRSTARFESLLGNDFSDQFSAFCADEVRANGTSVVTAELLYRPADARADNLGVQTVSTPFVVTVNADQISSSAEAISLNDILVGVDDGQLYLWAHRQHRRLVLTQHSMLNPMTAPNVVRFLLDVTAAGVRPVGPFDWGVLNELDTHLPRVTVPDQKIILATARWQVRLEDLKNLEDVTHSQISTERIAHELLPRWCREVQMPRHVLMVEGDNYLTLDTNTNNDRLEIARALVSSQESSVELQESLIHHIEPFVLSTTGDHHIAEFVITLKHKQQLDATQPWTAGIDTAQALLPSTLRRPLAAGDGWVYVKLYLERAAQDDFVSRQLPDIAAVLREQRLDASWFFVRYADPRPHIRLRVRSQRPENGIDCMAYVVGKCQTFLHDGTIQDFRVDTYHREWNRYGGLEFIDEAEQFFVADSVFVANQLRRSAAKNDRTTNDIRLLTFLPAMFDFLRSVTDAASTAIDLLSGLVTKQHGAAEYRRLRAHLSDLTREVGPVDPAVSAWLVSVQAAHYALTHSRVQHSQRRDILHSLMHMHCNRAGLDREQERAFYGVLRRMVEAWQHTHTEQWSPAADVPAMT